MMSKGTEKTINTTASRKRKLLCAFVGTVVIASTNALSTTTATNQQRMSLSGSESQQPEAQEFHFTQTGQGGDDSFVRGPLEMSPLSSMCEDSNEFDLNLGRAIDTLRHDYPDMLRRAPDYSIYSPTLVVVDPSGVKLNGLQNYQNAFRLVHTVVNLFYCPEKSLLTYRMVYDSTRKNLRVSWNVEVIPKALFGGTRKKVYVDGISVYDLGVDGQITQHRVEHLMINDSYVRPKRGIIHALKKEIIEPDCIPAFNSEGNAVVKFQQWNPVGTSFLFDTKESEVTLAAISASSEEGTNDRENNAMDAAMASGVDMEALERKNKSRKKFGLKPLTPDEFLEFQAKVHQMEAEAQKRQAANTDATNYPKDEKKGFLKGLFGGILEDTCETNYDCVRPELCCDFGFKKMCCSSGAMVSNQQPGQPIRVVAGYPPGTVPDDW